VGAVRGITCSMSHRGGLQCRTGVRRGLWENYQRVRDTTTRHARNGTGSLRWTRLHADGTPRRGAKEGAAPVKPTGVWHDLICSLLLRFGGLVKNPEDDELRRSHRRNADLADETAIQDVVLRHRGAVAGTKKASSSFAPMSAPARHRPRRKRRIASLTRARQVARTGHSPSTGNRFPTQKTGSSCPASLAKWQPRL